MKETIENLTTPRLILYLFLAVGTIYALYKNGIDMLNNYQKISVLVILVMILSALFISLIKLIKKRKKF